MSNVEGRARRTPYELVFSEGDFGSRVFPRIEAEAIAEGVGSLNPDRFEFLSTAADAIRQVTPEEAPPDALEQYRALLFHAYHLWRSGHPLFVVDQAVARYLVEAAPSLEGWSFNAPFRATYLQLPANLFWSSIAPAATPEPVDGFFLTVAENDDRSGGPSRYLEILMVLGIRRARAGFSVIPLRGPLGPDFGEAWDAQPRSEGDFASVLPGGEMAGLYSILTAAEALKLVGRVLCYTERFPDGLVEVRAAEPRQDAGDPPPTHLAYFRIQLDVAARGDDGAVRDRGGGTGVPARDGTPTETGGSHERGRDNSAEVIPGRTSDDIGHAGGTGGTGGDKGGRSGGTGDTDGSGDIGGTGGTGRGKGGRSGGTGDIGDTGGAGGSGSDTGEAAGGTSGGPDLAPG